MRNIGIGFLIIIGAIVAFYLLFSAKVYPVATVNGAFISARSFQTASAAAGHYYSNVLYASAASTTATEFRGEMRRLALQSLIEDELISSYLKTIYDPVSLEAAVSKRVDEALSQSGEQLAEGVQELFGVSLEEFKEIVLVPKARLELLIEDLESQQIDSTAWLIEQLKSARVSISLNDLIWVAPQVELSGEQTYTAKVEEVLRKLASSTDNLEEAASAVEEQY